MLVILAILISRTLTAIKQKNSRMRCLTLLFATVAYIIADMVWIIADNSVPRPIGFFRIWIPIFYIIYIALPFAWHIFVRNYVGSTYSPIVRKIEFVPLVFLAVVVIISPFTGLLWKINGGNADVWYERGVLYTFYSILNFFYYVEPIGDAIAIILRKKQSQEPYFKQSVFISLIPLVGFVINYFFLSKVGTVFPFNPFCSTIVALLAFFFMASREAESIGEQHQRAIQSALGQAQFATLQAKEANQVKTKFLSNMSHDIRTPMNAIINLTSLAQKETDMLKIQDYLSKMEISEKFLLGLINDILDMSRIESGEVVLHKENLTRSQFLKTVETVINPLMESKHLNFHPELNPGQYTISVDKLRFNQVFFNLLSNAAKFTPEGGDVWFEVNNKEVENGRLKIQFIVRDNGIGMSEEFQKHLFEPFAREHSEVIGATQGTGLGLSIVKNLVEAMDGTISVKSELGKGTEFEVNFYVDVIANEELSEEEKTNAQGDISGMQILLVEDNELNTYVAQTILEGKGCVVTTAQDGRKAVEAFVSSKEHTFDAILMDIRMPVMDGIEATKLIRESGRSDSQTIPIIAMTADAFDEERKRTLDAGMDYHLAKPVNAEQLCNVLGQCVAKK